MKEGKTVVWKNGITGVVIGDTLGCPVQFLSREEVAENPVTGMRGYGTFNLPAGSWTDDSSLTIAALCSIIENKKIITRDIMERFARWLRDGEYTPFGKSFDIGRGTYESIERFITHGNTESCGGTSPRDNGNGSLMRIMPACIYCSKALNRGEITADEAIGLIHAVSGLTHNHIRAKIACGLYFFIAHSIINGNGSLDYRISLGLESGFEYYENAGESPEELAYYSRLRNPGDFAAVTADKIRSSGYVVDTIEAAIWSLLNTGSFRDALLTAVNLGDDTDSVGAVCGGLAGLYYGFENIPADWIASLQKREYIEKLCDEADETLI